MVHSRKLADKMVYTVSRSALCSMHSRGSIQLAQQQQQQQQQALHIMKIIAATVSTPIYVLREIQ